MATAAFLGGMIAIGFLTPVAIVLFFALFMIHPPFFVTLGDQAAIIVFWLLILLGAGKDYSLDSLLMRWAPLNKPIGALYAFSVRLNPANFARVRFFGIFLFWSISFSAVSYHFFDDFWLNGDVLQVALVSGFWNDHYQWANHIKDNHPALFDVLCESALYIQAFFETFLIPLMYLGWPGRMFVCWQGVGFFGMSLLFFNLGYLPAHEFVMWGILFGYAPAIFPFPAPSPKKERQSSNVAFQSHPINGLIVIGIIVGALFNTVNFAKICGHPWNLQWPWNHQTWRGTHRAFAQESVNVFNREDLKTGAYRMVIYEVDETGVPLRLVPVMDLNGGRLDYLRNDYTYFECVIRWIRSSESSKFEDRDFTKTSAKTRQFANSMIELDAALTGPSAGRVYRVEVGKRDLRDGARFLVWGEWTSLDEWEVVIPPSVATKLAKSSSLTFDLGPGHWGSKDREARTLEILKRHRSTIPSKERVAGLLP